MRAIKPPAILAVFLLATSIIRAETIPGRWEMVDGLKLGKPIIVKLKAGDRIECLFKGSSPNDISFIDQAGYERRLPKEEILRIESTEKARDGLKNGTWIGAGLGTAGAIAGLYAYAESVTASGPIWDRESAGYFLTAGLAGAGIGALAGLVVDASIKKNEILYKAR